MNHVALGRAQAQIDVLNRVAKLSESTLTKENVAAVGLELFIKLLSDDLASRLWYC